MMSRFIHVKTESMNYTQTALKRYLRCDRVDCPTRGLHDVIIEEGSVHATGEEEVGELAKKKLVNWLLMGVLGDAHMYLKSKSKESVRWMAGSDLLRLIFGIDMYSDSSDASN